MDSFEQAGTVGFGGFVGIYWDDTGIMVVFNRLNRPMLNSNGRPKVTLEKSDNRRNHTCRMELNSKGKVDDLQESGYIIF